MSTRAFRSPAALAVRGRVWAAGRLPLDAAEVLAAPVGRLPEGEVARLEHREPGPCQHYARFRRRPLAAILPAAVGFFRRAGFSAGGGGAATAAGGPFSPRLSASSGVTPPSLGGGGAVTAVGFFLAVVRGGTGGANSTPKTAARSALLQDLAGRRGPSWRAARRLPALAIEVLLVHLPEAEQQLGLVVETRADAVEHRGDVLAHGGPVGTAARELDLRRRREEARALLAEVLHDALREPSLQQLDERVDAAGAARADRPATAAPGTGATLTATL